MSLLRYLQGGTFHGYFKYCNIWLNVLMNLSCIDIKNALLYNSTGNKKKILKILINTTYRQQCLSYICIVIFQQRESLRITPEAFLMPGVCLDKYE